MSRWLADVLRWLADVLRWLTDVLRWLADVLGWLADVLRWLADVLRWLQRSKEVRDRPVINQRSRRLAAKRRDTAHDRLTATPTRPRRSGCAWGKVGTGVVCSEKGVRLAQKMQVGHAFLWEYGDKRLKLAQLLGQFGVFLACVRV